MISTIDYDKIVFQYISLDINIYGKRVLETYMCEVDMLPVPD